MEDETEFWQARFRPRLCKRVEAGMIKADLKHGLAAQTAGGETTPMGVSEYPVVRANDLKPAYPAGKPISPSELREMGPRAPVIDGVRVFWDRSSWEGCAKGTKGIFQHYMVNIQKLHWLVKAQLARLGGRKGQNRMPPDAAGGYIMALRQTHAQSGGKSSTRNGRPSNSAGEPSTDPEVGPVPMGFRNINFAIA